MKDTDADAADFMRLCKTAVRDATRRLGVREWQLGMHDTEGLATEVFLKLWKKSGVDSAQAAVWVTAMRTVIDVLRKASRFSRFLRDELSQRCKEAYSPCELELSREQVAILLDEVIERVAPRDRAVILYCRDESLDLSDNAKIGRGLGISANAVAQSGRRIRKNARPLRPRLEELEGR